MMIIVAIGCSSAALRGRRLDNDQSAEGKKECDSFFHGDPDDSDSSRH